MIFLPAASPFHTTGPSSFVHCTRTSAPTLIAILSERAERGKAIALPPTRKKKREGEKEREKERIRKRKEKRKEKQALCYFDNTPFLSSSCQNAHGTSRIIDALTL